jgi:hypothetical protein
MSNLGKKKKTFTSTPLPLNTKIKKKKTQGAPFPLSHNELTLKKNPPVNLSLATPQ